MAANRPNVAAGRNIAMKVAVERFDETVAFHRDVVHLVTSQP